MYCTEDDGLGIFGIDLIGGVLGVGKKVLGIGDKKLPPPKVPSRPGSFRIYPAGATGEWEYHPGTDAAHWIPRGKWKPLSQHTKPVQHAVARELQKRKAAFIKKKAQGARKPTAAGFDFDIGKAALIGLGIFAATRFLK